MHERDQGLVLNHSITPFEILSETINVYRMYTSTGLTKINDHWVIFDQLPFSSVFKHSLEEKKNDIAMSY